MSLRNKIIMKIVITFTIIFLSHNSVLAQYNYLNNPDFEDPIGADDWFCNGACNLDRSTDAYNGSYSGRITERAENWQAVSQWVELEPSNNYYFSCWIKLLNQLPDSMWHSVQLLMAIDYVDDPEREFVWFGTLPYLKQSQGWQKIGADFYLDNRERSAIRLYVQPQDAGVDYLIDAASLIQLQPDPDWKEQAEERIQQIRKEDIIINLSVSDDYVPSDLRVQVTQTRHDFPFGSAVKHDQIIGTDEDSVKYQACFYENFKWSVLENALKWRQMERNRDEIRFPDESIDLLLANEVPVRGHTVFWGVETSNPDWLQPLPGEEIMTEMIQRLDYLIERYSGKIVHWDVNNEQLHGSFYEDKLGDPEIMAWMFQEVRARDPNVTLFLNDYQLVLAGFYTQSMVNSAAEFTALGADIQALGIQSHLRGVQDLTQVTAIQKRLEVLLDANLPMWITELDISQVTDASLLADSYEDILTLYFSIEQIKGVLLWGFSDQYHSKPDAALFEGPDYVPNESGLRWQELMNVRWKTDVEFLPTSPEETFGARGFHGAYTLQVWHNAEVISTTDFYLYPGEPITVDISV